MKTNNHFLKGIILMILFGLILNQVTAQDKNEGNRHRGNPHELATTPAPSPTSSTPPIPPPPPPPPSPPDIDHDNMHPPMDLPDLTDEQQENIKKADLKQLEAMTPLRNQMLEKKIRLTTILTTSPVDIKSADQVADEISKVAAAILKTQIRHDQEIRNLLTPDQKIIFDSRPKPFLHKPR
jgi:Spy/CpxP family protein refolding chaperone